MVFSHWHALFSSHMKGKLLEDKIMENSYVTRYFSSALPKRISSGNAGFRSSTEESDLTHWRGVCGKCLIKLQ